MSGSLSFSSDERGNSDGFGDSWEVLKSPVNWGRMGDGLGVSP